jgi:MOSC domain-containing protein YiiM
MHHDHESRNHRGTLLVAHVVSVNVGLPRAVELEGRTITTAIWKEPVVRSVAVREMNIAGDDQADRSVHGGPDKAVYAYAREDTDWWEQELGRPLEHGTFGENLTVRGLDVTNSLVGERWRIGTALMEVSQPRLPCFKLGLRMGDPRFVKRFASAMRPGAYLRIVEEGEVSAGDAVEVVRRPAHEITVELIARAYLRDHELAPRLLEAPELPDSWREWVAKRVDLGG